MKTKLCKSLFCVFYAAVFLYALSWIIGFSISVNFNIPLTDYAAFCLIGLTFYVILAISSILLFLLEIFLKTHRPLILLIVSFFNIEAYFISKIFQYAFCNMSDYLSLNVNNSIALFITIPILMIAVACIFSYFIYKEVKLSKSSSPS